VGRYSFTAVDFHHLLLAGLPAHRDVEELLAERGLDISYETVRCWVLKFGPMIA
jgi:transposase-like protein